METLIMLIIFFMLFYKPIKFVCLFFYKSCELIWYIFESIFNCFYSLVVPPTNFKEKYKEHYTETETETETKTTYNNNYSDRSKNNNTYQKDKRDYKAEWENFKKNNTNYEKNYEDFNRTSYSGHNSGYYDVLGIPNGVTDIKIIKAAYKNKMKIHHPDLGGSEEMTKKINEAYSYFEKIYT
jgi:hypothetical protein